MHCKLVLCLGKLTFMKTPTYIAAPPLLLLYGIFLHCQGMISERQFSGYLQLGFYLVFSPFYPDEGGAIMGQSGGLPILSTGMSASLLLSFLYCVPKNVFHQNISTAAFTFPLLYCVYKNTENTEQKLRTILCIFCISPECVLRCFPPLRHDASTNWWRAICPMLYCLRHHHLMSFCHCHHHPFNEESSFLRVLTVIQLLPNQRKPLVLWALE